MNQIEASRSWGRIVGQFALAVFLNLFAMAFIAMTYGAGGDERMWDVRLMRLLGEATFIFVPIMMIFAVVARLYNEERLAWCLAAVTWTWPLFLLLLRFAILAISQPKTA